MENCCTRPPVPGGTFNRTNNAAYPATVSAFKLDRYEVTVGRFRKFVNENQGTQVAPPDPGSGKNPNNAADTGWQSSFSTYLPATKADMEAQFAPARCAGSGWNAASGGDSLPITCVNWYTAFAFCIWDGGRLPTEAEWNFAAAGGGGTDGQRYYPWSSPPADTTVNGSYAVISASGPGNVGSRSTKGDAKWGHADMSGNVAEMVQDYSGSLPECTGTQHDCAYLTPNTNFTSVLRGGSFDSINFSTVSQSLLDRRTLGPSSGFRCAYAM